MADCSFQSLSPSEIVEKNYQRNQAFAKLRAEWDTWKDENSHFSIIAAYTGVEPYYQLLAMGPAIVAHCMLAHYEDPYGWWHELVCELICGHKWGASVKRHEAQTCWTNWFEHKDYLKAPYKLRGEQAEAELQLRLRGGGHDYAEFESESGSESESE